MSLPVRNAGWQRTRERLQAIAAERVQHLEPGDIRCRFCGETSASGSFKGLAHRWGPTGSHLFTAAKPAKVTP